MARDKYGIIKLELPEITLDYSFSSNNKTEITSLLTEEQKEIIKTLGGSKLVLLKCSITDASDYVVTYDTIINKDYNNKELHCIGYSDEDNIVCCRLCEESGKYYIYS